MQFESYRKSVPHVDRLSVHLAGSEIRESLYYTDCFLVKVGIFTAHHCHNAYRTVLLYYEPHDNLTLHSVFLSYRRIFYMIGDP